MITQRFICMTLNAALCVSAAGLAGCNRQPSPATLPASAASAAPAPAGTTAQASSVYTPPSADDLYQMVAPIALFPDKLVAQVLAGSTYPDQVTAADNFLIQNQSLQGSALQDQVDPQSWDPSIKGLTVFPKVLDQMAQNLPWTTALGEAYVNDPTDVLNAIQVMRARASKHGSLHSSAQMRVVNAPLAQPVSDDSSVADYPPVYAGPSVVPAPEQSIEILPAQDDTVYVPSYDPRTVYGEQISDYPGYGYQQPVYDNASSGYSGGQLVTAGAITFGVAILVGALLENSHHDSRPNYGWNSWGMNWGSGRHERDSRLGRDGGGWQRPAVVHNNTTYVSRSTTVINHYVTNNINNNDINNNNINNSVNNSNNRYADNQGRTDHNHPVAESRPPAPGSRAAAVPLLAGRRPAEPAATHAVDAHTPLTRPNFNGALTKGEPARFSRPDVVAHASEQMHDGMKRAPTVSPLSENRSTSAARVPAAGVRPPAADSRAAEVRAVQADRAATPTPTFQRGHAEAPTLHAVPQSHLAPQVSRVDQGGATESTKSVDQEQQQPAARVMPRSHLAPRVGSVLQRGSGSAKEAEYSAPHATLPAIEEIQRAKPIEAAAVDRGRPQPTERTAPAQERSMQREEAPPRQSAPIRREPTRPEAARQAPVARPAAAPSKKEPSKKDDKKSAADH